MRWSPGRVRNVNEGMSGLQNYRYDQEPEKRREEVKRETPEGRTPSETSDKGCGVRRRGPVTLPDHPPTPLGTRRRGRRRRRQGKQR